MVTALDHEAYAESQALGRLGHTPKRALRVRRLGTKRVPFQITSRRTVWP